MENPAPTVPLASSFSHLQSLTEDQIKIIISQVKPTTASTVQAPTNLVLEYPDTLEIAIQKIINLRERKGRVLAC